MNQERLLRYCLEWLDAAAELNDHITDPGFEVEKSRDGEFTVEFSEGANAYGKGKSYVLKTATILAVDAFLKELSDENFAWFPEMKKCTMVLKKKLKS